MAATTRAQREAQAYDEGDVWANCERWILRVHHVLECENTQRVERDMTARMRQAGQGRVLELGCAHGGYTAQLHEMGAREILGIDVSAALIETARRNYGHLQGVRFEVHSAEEPISGMFDLIVGRAVLHHIDFRSTLTRLYRDNLAPGGRMIFMEPMSHPFTLAFHRLVRSAHTEDEWPLTPGDVAWMRERFARVEVVPVNLVSFAAGIASSFVFDSANNRLMRAADRVDRWLAGRPAVVARGRQGLIDILKTGSAGFVRWMTQRMTDQTVWTSCITLMRCAMFWPVRGKVAGWRPERSQAVAGGRDAVTHRAVRPAERFDGGGST